MNEEGESDRLNRLRRWEGRCGIFGIIVSILPLAVRLLNECSFQRLTETEPEVIASTAVGILSGFIAVLASSTSSFRFARIGFILELWCLYTLQYYYIVQYDVLIDTGNRCNPKIENYGSHRDSNCPETHYHGISGITAAVIAVLKSLLLAVIALDFEDVLMDLKDVPLERPRLMQTIEWCCASGDNLVALEEFLLYQSQIKSLKKSRKSLLISNFQNCDGNGSGVLPASIFLAVYRVTFAGVCVSDLDELQSADFRVRRSRQQSIRSLSRRRSSRLSQPEPDRNLSPVVME